MDDVTKGLLYAGLFGLGLGMMAGLLICALTASDIPQDQRHTAARECIQCHQVMRVYQ